MVLAGKRDWPLTGWVCPLLHKSTEPLHACFDPGPIFLCTSQQHKHQSRGWQVTWGCAASMFGLVADNPWISNMWTLRSYLGYNCVVYYGTDVLNSTDHQGYIHCYLALVYFSNPTVVSTRQYMDLIFLRFSSPWLYVLLFMLQVSSVRV